MCELDILPLLHFQHSSIQQCLKTIELILFVLKHVSPADFTINIFALHLALLHQRLTHTIKKRTYKQGHNFPPQHLQLSLAI